MVIGRDPDDLCLSHNIHAIRQKSQLLCLAYSVALEKIETNKVTWEACCKEACVSLNAIGNIRATNYRTLSDYNIEFRSGEAFEHPNRAVMCGKKHVPSIFQAYPEAKQALVAFCLANLKTRHVKVDIGTYIDKQAAMVVHKQTANTPLAESPFVRHFLIGSNNDRWWNSMHMAIQTEDMADCLNVLYPDYDHLSLFDHSQGCWKTKVLVDILWRYS